MSQDDRHACIEPVSKYPGDEHSRVLGINGKSVVANGRTDRYRDNADAVKTPPSRIPVDLPHLRMCTVP